MRIFWTDTQPTGDAEQLRGICSQETLRRFTDDLKEHRVHFDLVVVDEAHHWRNPDTRLSELGEVLSEYADSLLMLTATPLHVGSENLFNLFRIMLPQQFGDFAVFQNLIEPNQFINAASGLLSQPSAALKALREVEGTSQKARFLANPYYKECVDLLSQRQDLAPKEVVHIKRRLVELNSLSHIFTRTKKRDVEVQFPARQARTVNVEYSPEEMDFYNAVTDFVETRFIADGGLSPRNLIRTDHASASGCQLHPGDAVLFERPSRSEYPSEIAGLGRG